MSDEQHTQNRVSEDVVVTAEVIDPDVHIEGDSPVPDLPGDLEEAVSVLEAALVASRSEAERYLDDYRRMAAEFDNYRKRAQRDQAEITARAAEGVVTALLPVLDSFDAAVGYEAETESEQNLVAGMRGTRDQLLAVLQQEGLEPIEAVGTVFDPNVHEAVQMVEGCGTMIVTGELRRGYRFKDRMLRPALVVVGFEEAHETA